jgi:hypothetical protein
MHELKFKEFLEDKSFNWEIYLSCWCYLDCNEVYLDWFEISSKVKLPENLILDLYDVLFFEQISKFQILSEKFIIVNW